jgi:hypothetical protein
VTPAAIALFLTACVAAPTPSQTLAPPVSPSATVAAPTSTPRAPAPTLTLPPATASPPASFSASATASPQVGLPSEGCVDGWSTPLPGSALFDEAVALVQARISWDVPVGPTVAEMRYFTGPDVAWIIEPHYDVVERWYVKTGLGPETRMLSGRWLVEKRTEQIKGVSAVAAWDSRGYASPDWVGFVGEGAATTYPDLPGLWSGIPYDFVTGEGDSGNPGLPDEVVDCLAGT